MPPQVTEWSLRHESDTHAKDKELSLLRTAQVRMPININILTDFKLIS